MSWLCEGDKRLVNATNMNMLTTDRPFVICGFLTIGEDKMVIVELLDIDILYSLTVSPSRYPLQSPSPLNPVLLPVSRTLFQKLKINCHHLLRYLLLIIRHLSLLLILFRHKLLPL